MTYFLAAVAAIPLLDLTGAVGFAHLYGVPVCMPHYPSGLIGVERAFYEVGSIILIGLANMGLFNHLIVISGRPDAQHPYAEHVAVLISCMLFASLIFLYATLYFIEMPCTHFVYRDRPELGRVAADFITSVYFSTITITTLGYGDFSPKNHLVAELVAAAQAINGLIAFGVFTGALAGFIAKR